jgi:hypothetical protein
MKKMIVGCLLVFSLVGVASADPIHIHWELGERDGHGIHKFEGRCRISVLDIGIFGAIVAAGVAGVHRMLNNHPNIPEGMYLPTPTPTPTASLAITDGKHHGRNR